MMLPGIVREGAVTENQWVPEKHKPMVAIYEHRLIVTPAAIDEQGRANNLEYIRWMQEAAVAHSTAQGWPGPRYLKLGAGWVVRSHWIEYLQPGFAGDELVVYTWVSNFHKVRSLRKYKIIRTRGHAVLAVAETDWAFIGLKDHAPHRVPQELINAFVIVPQDQEP